MIVLPGSIQFVIPTPTAIYQHICVMKKNETLCPIVVTWQTLGPRD